MIYVVISVYYNQKLSEEANLGMKLMFTTKIHQWGNTAGIRIRKQFMDAAGWHDGEELLMTYDDCDHCIKLKAVKDVPEDGQ